MGRKPWDKPDSARLGGRPWRRIRDRVLKRDGYLCQPCKAKGRVTPATEVHHIKARANGGTDDEANLVSTCHPCHEEADLLNRGYRPRQTIGRDGWPVS